MDFEEEEKAMRVAGTLFRNGRQLGFWEGLKQGLEKGLEKGKLEIAHKMLLASVDVGVASRIMGLPQSKLAALREK